MRITTYKVLVNLLFFLTGALNNTVPSVQPPAVLKQPESPLNDLCRQPHLLKRSISGLTWRDAGTWGCSSVLSLILFVVILA